MLSFAEKRALQRISQDKLEALEVENLSFQDKRAAQRALEETLSKLEGEISHTQSSLYDDLVAGKFIHEVPLKFLAILKKVITEIGGNVGMVHDPVIAYLKACENDVDVLESSRQSMPS